mgnify:CR=1 FL=1|tara:strand:+ start:5252 stop:5905 length:654 start_codon:yes stop_codon:yes gene_type:complete
MLNIKNYDSFLFDCDGVILDSNHIKTEAFRSALEDYPKEKVNVFINYHQVNGGVSRYEKIEYFFKTIHPKKNPNKFISESLDLYSTIVKKELIECELIHGVREFLDLLFDLSAECYVITGGDQEEVEYVFKKRGLSKYFIKILGSPKTKSYNMTYLKKSKNIPSNSVYFGDSKLDFEIAEEFGIDFILVSSKSEWFDGLQFVKDRGSIAIENFYEIL